MKRESKFRRDLEVIAHNEIVGERYDEELMIEEGQKAFAQIAELAAFILEEFPGEPSRSEGSVDTAIRLLRKSLDLAARIQEVERKIDQSQELRYDPPHTVDNT